MRLLWVTENYPPSRGGMAQSCDRIVRGLRSAGVQVDVAHLSRRAGAPQVTHELGGRLVTAPLGDDPEHALRLLWTQLVASLGGKSGVSGGTAYTHVVAFGGTYPLLAAPVYAAWAGLPLVTLLRGNDFDTGMFSLRRQPVVLDALRASARVCVVASNTEPLVRAVAPGVAVTVVGNSIDRTGWEVLPSERQKAAAWRAENVDDGRRTVGLIGQLKNKKGVRFLLDAVLASGHAERLHFVLAGELEPSVSAWLGEQDRIRFSTFPFLDRYELLTVYAACDVVALPSFYDGLPNVALEAAALGIPLLASDAGGLADLVDDGIGFRFVAGDAAGCRAAVHRAATAPDDALGALGTAAAERVRRGYGPAREVDGYLRVLAEVAVG
jgi:glycosyltransferase involved in cell wall biosynthesis